MKVKEVIKLYETLSALNNRMYSTKFSYAIIKNRKLAKDIIDEVQSDIRKLQTSQEYIDYEKGLEDLKLDYCKKDKSGSPDLIRNAYGQMEYQFEEGNEEKLDKAIESYKKKNKKVVDLQTKITEEYKKNVESEIEFKWYKVSEDYMPEQIEPAYLEIIQPMILDIPKLIL